MLESCQIFKFYKRILEHEQPRTTLKTVPSVMGNMRRLLKNSGLNVTSEKSTLIASNSLVQFLEDRNRKCFLAPATSYTSNSGLFRHINKCAHLTPQVINMFNGEETQETLFLSKTFFPGHVPVEILHEHVELKIGRRRAKS